MYINSFDNFEIQGISETFFLEVISDEGNNQRLRGNVHYYPFMLKFVQDCYKIQMMC